MGGFGGDRRKLTKEREVPENIAILQRDSTDTSALEAEQKLLEGEMNTVAEMVQETVNQNARVAQKRRMCENRFMKRYELTSEQWERIASLLPPERKGKREAAPARITGYWSASFAR